MTQITLSAEELKQLLQTAVRDNLLERMGEIFNPESRLALTLSTRAVAVSFGMVYLTLNRNPAKTGVMGAHTV